MLTNGFNSISTVHIYRFKVYRVGYIPVKWHARICPNNDINDVMRTPDDRYYT
jgi:hypothetical protein